MTQRKASYRAGDWFAVPLRDGRWAAGRIARLKRPILLAYFFGPRRQQPPELREVSHLTGREAVYLTLCGDLGFRSGQWIILGRHDAFEPAAWPVPAFKHESALTGGFERRLYNDDLSYAGSEPIAPDQAQHLPDDGLAGHGYAEIRLTRALGGEVPRSATPKGAPTIRHFLYFSTRPAAARVAAQLRAKHFAIEMRQSDSKWLVIASGDAPADVDAQVAELTEIAKGGRGDYDGFERDVTGPQAR